MMHYLLKHVIPIPNSPLLGPCPSRWHRWQLMGTRCLMAVGSHFWTWWALVSISAHTRLLTFFNQENNRWRMLFTSFASDKAGCLAGWGLGCSTLRGIGAGWFETADSASVGTGMAGICTKRPSGRRNSSAVTGSLLETGDGAGTKGRGKMDTPAEGTAAVLLTIDCKLVFLPLSFLDESVDVTMVDALRFPLAGLAGSGLLGERMAASCGSVGAVTIIDGVELATGGTGVHTGDGSVRHSEVEREGMR